MVVKKWARNNPRVIAVNWFSLGNPTGLVDMADTLGPWVWNWQREVAEEIK
jgi:hypothetical protein